MLTYLHSFDDAISVDDVIINIYFKVENVDNIELNHPIHECKHKFTQSFELYDTSDLVVNIRVLSDFFTIGVV